MNGWFAQLLGLVRQRPVVTICYALVVVLGGANYFLWRKRVAVTAQHDEVRRNGEFMLSALANRGRIETDLADLRAAMAQIERNLIEEESMEINLGYFYRLERVTRVRLTRLNQLRSLSAAAGSPYTAVPFSMQVVGPYRTLMRFLRELETGPRVLRVRDCSFERGPADDADLILDLTVDVLAKI